MKRGLSASTVVLYVLWWFPTTFFHFLSWSAKYVALQLDHLSWWFDRHFQVYEKPIDRYLDALQKSHRGW